MITSRGTSVRRAMGIQFLQQYLRAGIGIAGLLVLARLLTPKEIGTFSIAAVFVGFLHYFRDFGVSEYVIQEQSLTPERIASARALIFTNSWILAALIFFAAEPMAEFYKEPELAHILHILSINFALIPFGAMMQSYMRRMLRMEILFRIDIASSTISMTVSVISAYLGYGAVSLAYGSFAGVIVTVVLSSWHRPDELRVRPAFLDIRRVLRFSAFSAGNALLGQWQKGAATLVLGKLQSTIEVGLLSRAMSLGEMFYTNIAQPVWSVMLPALSRSMRDGTYDPASVARMISLLTGIALPFYMFTAIWAGEIISTLFGDQWQAAVPAAQVMSIYGATQVISGSLMRTLVAVGRIAENTVSTTLSAILTPIAVFATAALGLPAIAAGLCIVMGMEVIFRAFLVHRYAGMKIAHWIQALGRSLGLTLLVGIAAAAIQFTAVAAELPSLVRLGLALGIAGMAWIVALFVFRHEILVEGPLIYRSLFRSRRLGTP